MRNTLVGVVGAGLVAAGGVVSGARAEQGVVAWPHPLMTEVLSSVPSGSRGDANADGRRDAVGDEFVELVNPHDRPIQLKGYVLVDADAWQPGAPKPDDKDKPGAGKPRAGRDDRAQVRFVFPELELKPGEVVVVFNGYNQTFGAPVGDAAKAPAGKNDKFHGAWVLTMKNESPYAALGNDGDFVMLVDPAGKPVHVVKWGSPPKQAPSDAAVVEEAPAAIGSVQRDGVRGKIVPHKELKGDLAGTVCSPGVFSLKAGEDAPRPSKPDAKEPKPGSGK